MVFSFLSHKSLVFLNSLFYEAHVDEKNKVVSTPTFMWETDYHYHYIFDGIGNMVKHVMRMTSKQHSSSDKYLLANKLFFKALQ
ncbi:hypothetical protein SRHO_G00321220 [Serrasalmus rhombeus]